MEGIVKYFSIKKGYGFIDFHGKDYFVQAWDIKAKSKPKKGDRVSFYVEEAPKAFRAIKVRKIENK